MDYEFLIWAKSRSLDMNSPPPPGSNNTDRRVINSDMTFFFSQQGRVDSRLFPHLSLLFHYDVLER